MGVGSNTKYILWGKAAGHCEICAAPLDEGLFRMRGNYSNVAHIKAKSPGGPRYDPNQCDEERHGIGNLMLLCPRCHKSIDANEEEYPVEMLLKKKTDFEEAIAQFASARVIPEVDVVTYFYPIRGQRMEQLDVEWQAALHGSGMSYTGTKPFSIDGGQKCGESFAAAAEYMERQFAKWEATVSSAESPVAVFAMAPQPLLIKLGSLIGDKRVVYMFQWHREEKSWSWREDGLLPEVCFDAPSANPCAKDVNLIVSMSGEVNPASIPEAMQPFPTGVLRAEAPSIGVASNAESLEAFAQVFIGAVCETHALFPSLDRLHIYPAMPASMAVKLGMSMNMNLLKKVVVYEKDGARFHEALEIGC